MSTGGPAFPVPEVSTATGQVKIADAAGMTLRDYFAAAALQGLVARGAFVNNTDELAFTAYNMADAMIKKRAA
jgi:hypothetical protein